MPKRNDLEQKALHYVVGTGYQGVLQSDLWRELGASSREGSRVSIKLEEKGLIRREKELPHLMHLSLSILWGFLTSPETACCGHSRKQRWQPVHTSSRI